jgi:hypothetical protein
LSLFTRQFAPIHGDVRLFLFSLQNVFQQQVFKDVRYQLSAAVVEHPADAGVVTDGLDDLRGQEIDSATAFREALRKRGELPVRKEALVIGSAEIYRTAVTQDKLKSLDGAYLGTDRTKAVEALAGRSFAHKWQLSEALMGRSPRPGRRKNRARSPKTTTKSWARGTNTCSDTSIARANETGTVADRGFTVGVTDKDWEIESHEEEESEESRERERRTQEAASAEGLRQRAREAPGRAVPAPEVGGA